MDIPALGFGTYGRWGDAGEAAILAALETGYRHIDTAQTYGTEAECGRAFRASGLGRDEVFFTTKITSKNYGPGLLIPSLEASLETMGLEKIDLTLIHWPAPNGERPVAEYLTQLAEAQERGLTEHIGVSNFTIALLKEAQAAIPGRKLLTNQFELHPYLRNARLEAFCREQGIRVTAYEPLAKAGILNDPLLGEIAGRHGASRSQVVLAWHLAAGRVPIPTSGNPRHIAENFAARDLTLSPEDIAAIETLNRNERHIHPVWGPEWD